MRYHAEMRGRARLKDRSGRVWTIDVTTLDANDDVDAAHWARTTPDERVALVAECLLDGEKTRGRRVLPRLRRTYRVTQRAPR